MVCAIKTDIIFLSKTTHQGGFMGKKPITSAQVKTLRNNVKNKPLQELLLNLGVDLMLRSSDLLNLKVSDVVSDSGKVKSEVKVRQKKTGKTTLNIPLSKNSINSIKKHLVGRDLDSYIFVGNKSHYTKSPITQKQYSRIVKNWMSSLGVEDVNNYSTHSIRKTKSSEIFKQTQNVEVCRRLLGHANITATSQYLGLEDSDALEVARNINL